MLATEPKALIKCLSSILIAGVLLTNCASKNGIKSHSGEVLGAFQAGGLCAGVVDSPEAVAACAMTCSDLWRRMFVWFDGKVNPCDYDYKSLLSNWNAHALSISEIWNSDFNTHKSYFVDHLIGAPNNPSITTWYNPNTKNSGIIKTTRTFYRGPLKCRTWESTIDITPSFPLNWIGSPIRNTNTGTACIMPDGRVEILQ